MRPYKNEFYNFGRYTCLLDTKRPQGNHNPEPFHVYHKELLRITAV